jgi:hypothetical protein
VRAMMVAGVAVGCSPRPAGQERWPYSLITSVELITTHDLS